VMCGRKGQDRAAAWERIASRQGALGIPTGSRDASSQAVIPSWRRLLVSAYRRIRAEYSDDQAEEGAERLTQASRSRGDARRARAECPYRMYPRLVRRPSWAEHVTTHRAASQRARRSGEKLFTTCNPR